MKKNILYILLLGGLIALFSSSCTKDFKSINVDPSVVSNVDVRYLFTTSLEALQNYREGEWVWEDAEQWLKACQLLTAENYEMSGSVNSRYNQFYTNILPNLFEMRRLIDLKVDKATYQKIYATTFIVQVFHGLKVTDMNGSIPYKEANGGRTEGVYNPVYDNQKTLYDTWLNQLNYADSTLQSNSTANQVTFGNNDVFYQGDWSKWIKLANSLKLRIAARYQNPDPTMSSQIFKEVMTDPVGPFASTADQFTYTNTTYPEFSEIDYRSVRFATQTVVNFMKSTGDPRLGIYYDKNSLVGSFQDSLTKYNVTLPTWCDLNDPNIMYQGGPPEWASDPAKSNYFSNPITVGSMKYSLISKINRHFFSPKSDNNNGNAIDVLVSYAEVCFHIAEYIEKGYGTGFDTKGTAADWYNKGVRASIETMNNIGMAAKSTYFDVNSIEPMIDSYLTNSNIQLDGGNNDLEKIYIQQMLNFYRQGNEAFTLLRRSGYPKFNSTIWALQPVAETIARRYGLADPGVINRTNWNAAMTEEGFTPNDVSLVTLNAQRLWFDKNSPNFGEGN